MREMISNKSEYWAVVIGLGTNGLAVVRALAGQGVPTRVLLTKQDKETPYYYSKYGEKIILPDLEGPTVLQYINSLSEKAVLFPTLEHLVAWFSINRELLEPRHKLQFPAHETVSMMLDKEQFDRFGRKYSLLLPGSWVVRNMEDLVCIKQEGSLPLIIKPTHKQYCSSLAKAYIVDSYEELVKRVEDYLSDTSECVVQEYVLGGDQQVYFCMQYISENGVLQASFTGRKIRQWQPLSGGTASCEPVYAPELHKITSDIFQKAGFWGIGSMEYKQDPRDGLFYCIEPTVGRTDFQEYVAIVNGVNIPYIAYCHAVNRPVASAINDQSDKAWMHFTNDRLAVEKAMKKKELTRWQWLYSLRRVRAFDFFSIYDLGPLWFFGKTFVRNRLGK